MSFLFVSLLAASAVAEPPIPVDPSLTDAATFRYQYVEGTSDTYRMDMTQQMTMSGLGMGNATTEMQMIMDTVQACQGVDEAGVGTIEQTLQNTRVNLTVNGQSVPAGDVAGMIDGLTMTLQMSPTGTIIDSEIGNVADPQLAQMVSTLEDSFGQMTLEFPENELAVGGTWTQELPFDMDQPGMDMDTSTTANYTFLGWATAEGAQVAVIQTTVTVTLSGTFTEMGITTTATGTGSGQGYTYFDNAGGKIHSGVMEMTMDMAITGEGMSLDQDMVMTVNISKI